MAIPVEVPLITWGSFGVSFVVALLFAVYYICHFQGKRHRERSTTVTAVLALTVAILTVALVPIDIFSVSFLKNDDGTYKEWAESNATREYITDTLLYSYYVLYGCIAFFVFLAIPFMIFYYEEQDEETTTKERICGAIKYTACFVISAAVLLVIGAFVPLQEIPNRNATNWEDFEYLLTEFGKSKGETALYFLIGFVTLIGMLGLIFYTAYGVTALPVDLIKGRRSAEEELEDVQETASANRDRVRTLRRKRRRGRNLSATERRHLDDLKDEEELIQRKERHLVAIQQKLCYRCTWVWRPLQVIIGIVLILVAILVFGSLLISSLDRLLHSLGYKTGYILTKSTLPNPVDMLLVVMQQVFPLDYIVFVGLVLFFIYSSMAGIRRIGIWFFCVKMYKIRPHHTKPQALLFLCMYLMFLLLAVNVMLYNLAPDYMTYGHQKFLPDNSSEPEQCTTSESSSDCTMTVTMGLMTKFVFQLWFFGACYYWANWVFLGFILIGLIISLLRRRRSSIEDQVDSSDSEDSDEEMLTP
ncbi:probable lysosomal cobalamin transporter [Acanthaster planci]|uniref:Probable lysosomal cobalamin transporter n=1 Tax=Acanthaster planci TaxID=133434 RepID=A0A8B7YJ08_ACAPL|nr:probable lysosomal cobalamin transporter [Acanthaster planci]